VSSAWVPFPETSPLPLLPLHWTGGLPGAALAHRPVGSERVAGLFAAREQPSAKPARVSVHLAAGLRENVAPANQHDH
jgi:hypothetical protein